MCKKNNLEPTFIEITNSTKTSIIVGWQTTNRGYK